MTVDHAHLATPEARAAASARLARLALPPDELAALTHDLERIVGYVNQLQALDLTDVPPTSHPLDLSADARPDTASTPLPRDAALDAAPSHDGAAFIVPKVV